jgi:hypothetical protein
MPIKALGLSVTFFYIYVNIIQLCKAHPAERMEIRPKIGLAADICYNSCLRKTI